MKPWYMYPVVTCKVLNRIANRIALHDTGMVRKAMDYATEMLWSKQEKWYGGVK